MSEAHKFRQEKTRGKVPKRRRLRYLYAPRLVGVLLMVVFFLGMAMSVTQAFSPTAPLLSDVLSRGDTTMVFVSVQNETGEPLGGVSVRLLDLDVGTTTNSEGSALFRNVTGGDHEMTATLEGHMGAVLKVTARSHFTNKFTITLKAGEGTEELEPQTTGTGAAPKNSDWLLAAIFGTFSVLAFIGGFFSLYRRNYRVAFIGSTFGIMSFGFLWGSLVSLFAFVWLVLYKRDYSASGCADYDDLSKKASAPAWEMIRGAEGHKTPREPRPATCAVCSGAVSMNFPRLHCKCDAIFHLVCAKDLKECSECGRELSKAKEETPARDGG